MPVIEGAGWFNDDGGRFCVDGFVIIEHKTGEPVGFVASTKTGRMRERVEDGLLMRVDYERFSVYDTRDED